MNEFPINLLKESSSSGLLIHYFMPGKIPQDNSEQLGTHRDDFYMFFLVESGVATLMVDLHDIVLQSSSVFYVLPGQVHCRFSTTENIQGWFIAVEASLVPSDYRDTFESLLSLQKPMLLSPSLYEQCRAILSLLHEKYHEEIILRFQASVIDSLLHSFLGIAAGMFTEIADADTTRSRATLIAQEFKKLLVKNMFSIKSPSGYASLLNISEAYLNEVIKKKTGFPVSYWIHHQIVLEPKRLLFHTQLNVKEIAYRLGYEDKNYFSRVFKNFTGDTPLGFRDSYHK